MHHSIVIAAVHVLWDVLYKFISIDRFINLFTICLIYLRDNDNNMIMVKAP